MNFTQIEFFIFFLPVFLLIYLTGSNRLRKIVLLAAGGYFYAYWDYRFLLLISVPVVTDCLIGRELIRSETGISRKFLLGLSVTLDLAILGFFKYYNFFISSIQPLLDPLGISTRTLSIILPLGISFYIFKTLTYTIEAYQRKITEPAGLLDYSVFVTFFPTIVAGPIVRASAFLPQLKTAPRISRDLVLDGSRLFIIGLFKKAFIADRIGYIVDFAFTNTGVFNSVTVWLSALSYSLQLYCDFSGYSDMARGTARMMGYELPENFNYPYISRNIAEFWRRWHISLSSWIRDFLYIPLGGNRKGEARAYVNLMISMFLCGLWHGAAWTFVFWGLFHGAALAVYRYWNKAGILKDWAARNPGITSAAGWLATIITVVIGWVIFRSQDFSQAALVIRKMFVFSGGVAWYHPFILFILPAAAVVHALEAFRLGRLQELQMSAWYTPAVLLCMIWLVIIFFPVEYQPFIYARF